MAPPLGATGKSSVADRFSPNRLDKTCLRSTTPLLPSPLRLAVQPAELSDSAARTSLIFFRNAFGRLTLHWIGNTWPTPR
jgi:hypothetical protein